MDTEQFPKLDEALLRGESGGREQDRELLKILSDQELADSKERAKIVQETFSAVENYRNRGLKRIQAILDPTAPQYRPERFVDVIEGIDIFRETAEGIDESILKGSIDRTDLERQEFWKTLSFDAQRDILHDIQHIDGRLDLFYSGAASHQLPGMQDYGNYYIGVCDNYTSKERSYDTRERVITVARKMSEDEVKDKLTKAKIQFESSDFTRDNFDKFYHVISWYKQNWRPTPSNAPAIGTRSALHPNE